MKAYGFLNRLLSRGRRLINPCGIITIQIGTRTPDFTLAGGHACVRVTNLFVSGMEKVKSVHEREGGSKNKVRDS